MVSKGNTEESESLALRYDLTVPFARYVKTKGLKKLKRYQVGKVFRRDQPNMKAGRFREFLQCDYDCLDGKCDPNLADAETLSLLIKVVERTAGYDYTIRINDRNILYSMLCYCEVPESLYGTVCSSIDKLDKKKWKDIVPELISKGLSGESIEQLGSVLKEYQNITWENLKQIPFVPVEVQERFAQIYRYLKILNTLDSDDPIRIDLTLARGLDYYTGIIFEVVLTDKKKKKVGSIAGGGRYDQLCGVPCVGFSVGIDRILSTLKPWPKREFNPKVWVIQVNPDESDIIKGLYEYRLGVLTSMREGGIETGTELRKDTGMGAQIKYVLKNEIPFIIFLGPKEMRYNTVSLKDMDAKVQYDNLSLNEVIWRLE